MHNKSEFVPNPDDGYEISDASVKWGLVAGVGMAVFTLIGFVVSVFFGRVLMKDDHPTISTYEKSGFAGEHNEWTSDVRLQASPPTELQEHKAQQRKRATTYGTVSESPEIYHIPLSAAIDHVAEHGLPVWAIKE